MRIGRSIPLICNYNTVLLHSVFLPGNPFGSGQLLHLNPEYESLPRRTTIALHSYGEFFVHLRHEANGFGFKLLGGSEEGTQVRILRLINEIRLR